MSDYCSDLSDLANKVKPLIIKTRTVAAIAATVGALSKATGTTWGYNEDTNSFYEMTPMSDDKTLIKTKQVERQTHYGGTYAQINADMIDAWEALMESGIPDREYTFGELPGIEGTTKDKTEYICQNFAISAAYYLNSIKDEEGNQKFYAIAMNLVGTDQGGDIVPHTVVKIEDRTNAIAYWIDPSAGVWSEKEETRLESMQKWIKDPRSYTPFATTRIPITTQVAYAGTIVEPQTGQTGKTGYDLTGTKMRLGIIEYTIEHTEELPNVIQSKSYVYDEGHESMATTSIGKNRITRTTENYAPALEEIRQVLYDINAPKEALELYDKDMSFATMKQTPETEKENAKIILEKKKQIASKTKSTEELKLMNPLESITQQSYDKKTINLVKTPIIPTSDDEKQLEEIAKEMEKTEMWTGE